MSRHPRSAARASSARRAEPPRSASRFGRRRGGRFGGSAVRRSAGRGRVAARRATARSGDGPVWRAAPDQTVIPGLLAAIGRRAPGVSGSAEPSPGRVDPRPERGSSPPGPIREPGPSRSVRSSQSSRSSSPPVTACGSPPALGAHIPARRTREERSACSAHGPCRSRRRTEHDRRPFPAKRSRADP